MLNDVIKNTNYGHLPIGHLSFIVSEVVEAGTQLLIHKNNDKCFTSKEVPMAKSFPD